MVQEEITLLLEKQLHGQLSQTEIARLKSLIREADDHSLGRNLEQLWESYENTGNRNQEAFDHISSHLKEMIRPRKLYRLFNYSGRIAAAVLFVCLFSFTAYLYVDRNKVRTAMTMEYQVVAEKGERASVILPDGTKVSLNAASTLSYPASFTLENRTVRLTGEAYCEVAHDANVPFIVKTAEVEVKVLGTVFNLCANPADSWFEASLVEGRIEVTPYRTPNKQVRLSPSQKAHYNIRTGELKIIPTDLQIETAWKRGDLIFRNQPFHEIVKQLEVFYGVTVSFEGACPEELFTGSFHETDITQVLKNLQQHYAFEYQKSGNDISLEFIE